MVFTDTKEDQTLRMTGNHRKMVFTDTKEITHAGADRILASTRWQGKATHLQGISLGIKVTTASQQEGTPRIPGCRYETGDRPNVNWFGFQNTQHPEEG